MIGIRRIAGAAAFSGLLVAGLVTGVALTAGTALADTTIGSCTLPTPGGGYSYACTIANVVVNKPRTIDMKVTFTVAPAQITLGWSADCTVNGTTTSSHSPQTTSYDNATSSIDEPIPFSPAEPDSCTVWAQINTSTIEPYQTVTLTLVYTSQPSPSSSPSASPSPSAPGRVHQVRGFDGTCVDDKANSSAKRAVVEIWTCNATDAAQGWTYRGSELKIRNMCVNAKGSGKSGSKIILWTCNGGPNEIWIHKSNGEYVLKANGYKLCLDDPSYSTRNGTQLVVSACHNTANQHWSLP